MRFCIRRKIDLNNSEERLRKVDHVPVEIALPPRLSDFCVTGTSCRMTEVMTGP
jgi:hypothetical protein